MDPVSLAGLGLQTLQLTLQSAGTLQQFIRDTRHVNATVRELALEINSLERACRVVNQQLQALAAEYERSGKHGDAQPALWDSIQKELESCKKTLNTLRSALINVQKDSSNFVQQGWRQLKLNMKQEEIAAMKGRIQSHTAALQVCLLVMDINVSHLAPRKVGEELKAKLNDLETRVFQLQQLLHAHFEKVDIVLENGALTMASTQEEVTNTGSEGSSCPDGSEISGAVRLVDSEMEFDAQSVVLACGQETLSRGTRPDLELLFLRVLPLKSINSKLFLQGLVPAVDGWHLPESSAIDEVRVWNSLLDSLAKRGCLLPGTVEDLGHANRSWAVRWPSEGIHASTAFARLQYHGKYSTTFNEIPTGQFSYERLVVRMTNDETYSIDLGDHKQISTLVQGSYSMTRCEDNSLCDLEITESELSGQINEAVDVVNEAIRLYNDSARLPEGQERSSFKFRVRPDAPTVFRELGPALRLTRIQATLSNGTVLAVAYKLNGRNVSKSEAMGHMLRSVSKLYKLFKIILEKSGRLVATHYDRHIVTVNQLLASERQAREFEMKQPVLSDAPIARSFGPDDTGLTSLKIWHEYEVDLVTDPRDGRERLKIEAESDTVQTVVWRLPGQQADITLSQSKRKLVIAPLKPVEEAVQNEEVRVGDVVLLAGRYLIVVEVKDNDRSQGCIMHNWLGIQESAGMETKRRGRNYERRDGYDPVYFV